MPRGHRNPEVGPPGPWVELDGYKFPLVTGKDGKGQLQFRPVTQFAPASQIGPANRPPPDPRFLVATFSDLSRGAAVQQLEEIDGLNTYRKGTFDTRNKRGFGMPPVVETLPTAIGLSGKGYASNKLVQGGFTRCQVLRKAGGEAVVYVIAEGGGVNDWYFAYNLNDDTIDADTATIYGTIYYGSWFFAATTSGIKYTASGGGNTAFSNTGRTGDSWRGLAKHDNKLWSFNFTDKKIYASNDPTTSASWTAQSVALEDGGKIEGLLAYHDLHNNPALVVYGEGGAWGLDQEADPAEWQQIFPAREWGYRESPTALTQNVFTMGTVWRKDNNAYFAFPGSPDEYGLHVMQHNGTARDVGPLQAGGFDKEDRFNKILKVEGNTHFLYAFAVGTASTQDEVLCMNDTGGWHTIWVNDDASNHIVAGAVDGGDIYVVLASGTIKVIRDRDNASAPNVRYPSGGGYTQDSAELETGFLDWGLPNHYKLLTSGYVAVVDRGGFPNLPTGNTLVLTLHHDSDGDVYAGNTYAIQAGQGPWRFPLPDTGQDGMVARKVELKVTATQTGSAEPFMIEEISLYAERWVEPFWAYQMVIDLTEESFRGFPERLFDGVDLYTLRAKLAALAGENGTTPPLHFPASWGHGEWAKSIVSAELMYGGTFDPRKGDGIFQVTVRDMSMPHDGTSVTIAS